MSRLVVVSNRVATPTETKGSAGGLAVGVFGALKDSGGVWFGWSGDVVSESVANAGPTLVAGRRGHLRDRRPAEEGLRPVLPRLFERDALAGLPLSQRPRRLRPRGICGLPPRQFVARAQADQAAATRRRHLGPRLSPDPVRRSAALRRRDEPHGLFPAHSVSVAADPAQHSAARGTREVAVLLRRRRLPDRHGDRARVSRLHRASRARHRDAPMATCRGVRTQAQDGRLPDRRVPRRNRRAGETRRSASGRDGPEAEPGRPQADHERRPARLFERARRALSGVRAFPGEARRNGAATSRSCRSRRRRARTSIPISRSARTSNTKQGASTAVTRASTTRRSAI